MAEMTVSQLEFEAFFKVALSVRNRISRILEVIQECGPAVF